MSRVNYFQLAPEAFSKLAAVTKYLESSSLNPLLRALLSRSESHRSMAASYVDLHTEYTRRLGETHQRLDMLPLWHEAPYYDERERAALCWAESLTHVSATHAPDADYECLCEYFSEKQIVDLSIAITVMNAWNRIAIRFRKMPD